MVHTIRGISAMNKRRMTATFIILFFLFALGLVHSKNARYNQFDAQSATMQIDDINHQLSIRTFNYEELYSTVKLIKGLQEQANECINNGKIQLQNIDDLLKNNAVSSELTKEQDIRYQYLTSKRAMNAKITAECVFFNYRAQELLNDINAKMAHTHLSTLLKKTAPIWSLLDKQLFFSVHINKNVFYHYSGIDRLNNADFIMLALILIIGITCTFLLRKKSIKDETPKNSAIKYSIIKTFSEDLPFLAPIFFAALYLHWVLFNVKPIPGITLLFDGLLAYLLIITLVRLCLTLMAQYSSSLNEHLVQDILKRFTVLLTLLLLGYKSAISLKGQWLPPPLIHFRFTVFITLLNLALWWLSWLIFQMPFFKRQHSLPLRAIAKILLAEIFIFTIIMAWFGYNDFAIYFIPNMIATLLVIMIVIKGTHILSSIYYVLDDPNSSLSKKIHSWMGLSSRKKLIELLVIRFILSVGLIVFSMFIFMKIWGVSQYYIDHWKGVYLTGFSIYGFNIWPQRIVRGIIMFCLIVMIGRGLSTYIGKSRSFRGETYRQDTIATLVTYTIFAFAVFIALLIAGIDFSNLALIAGALSIGIGFGLQHLASDLVSGIILLIRKPVAPGDLVIIDDTEGYIKKIRLLSTQITTLSHADVIIPNSNLINKSFTNYTFHNNKICRIGSQIILDSNTDLELARKILINVANSNPYVIQELPYDATVRFSLTPAHNNLFVIVDLWYFIKDVDLKESISSDINFAIITTLKEHGMCPGQKEGHGENTPLHPDK